MTSLQSANSMPLMEIRGLLPTFPQDVNKSEQMGGFKAIIEISLFGSELDRIYGTLYQVKYEIYIYICEKARHSEGYAGDFGVFFCTLFIGL
jgi:hypothetical protein